MTSQSNANKRPVLRDTETRAELDGAKSSGKRPALASPQNGATAKDGASGQTVNRPSASKQTARSREQESPTLPAPGNPSKYDVVSEADFSNIKAFIDSLGDTQVGLDVDEDSPSTPQSSTDQPPSEPLNVTDEGQDKQNASSAPTVDSSAVATSGTERDRSGLESDLASIRLEDTDYRRIGHRNNDDKPLATIIKGGIAI